MLRVSNSLNTYKVPDGGMVETVYLEETRTYVDTKNTIGYQKIKRGKQVKCWYFDAVVWW